MTDQNKYVFDPVVGSDERKVAHVEDVETETDSPVFYMIVLFLLLAAGAYVGSALNL